MGLISIKAPLQVRLWQALGFKQRGDRINGMKLTEWGKIKARLVQMDREELRERTRQEFRKRADGVLSRLGFDLAQGVPNSSARNWSAQERGRFFWEPASTDSLVALLRQRLPDQAELIVKRAEKLCRHRFDLLGYGDLDYGATIDWHLDRVHEKRSPRKLFYKVRYLDFDEVGDSKVTWELNRHQHFLTLASAYRLTGNLRFVDEILRQWRHWQAENPYPIGINWASSLEVAFRSLSWLWTLHLLEGSRDVPDFRNEWLRGLARHGRHIERYLSTYFSPNTHLLGEGVGLFFLGVLCPELARAEGWKSLGWDIIVRESERQIRDDGFHFEQSTYYHVYALDFFLHSAVLASMNNIPIPHSFEQRLEKMLNALCLLGRCGTPPRFGDDDGGRVFDPCRNRAEHLLDPLATGATLFQRSDFKSVAGGLREETLWLLGAEGVRRWDDLAASPPPMNSTALEKSGFYLLTTDNPPAQLVFDGGPQGAQSGGHGHADALNICSQRVAPFLIDPGTYQYVGKNADRDLFRGTAKHNTLLVDSADQAEASGPFAWKRLTQTRVEQWIQNPAFDLVTASHDGYQRPPEPVIHRRTVISLKNGICLVRDVVEGQGRHRLDISWHLGADMQQLEANVFRVQGEQQGLAIVPLEGSGWEQELRKQAWSPVYGQKAPATVLNLGTVADVPAEFACVLVTLADARPAARSLTRIAANDSGAAVTAYRYAEEGRECFFFFATPKRPWRQDLVLSDAEFVCWCRSTGSSDHLLLMSNGSYTEITGGPELRCQQAVRWAELVVQDGRRSLRSSNPEAATGAG